MKSLVMILAGVLLAFPACSAMPPTPAQATPPAAATSTESAGPIAQTPAPVDLTAARRAATAALADKLGIPASQVQCIASESVTWPDGCLGVQRLGVMCTQAQVPGYRLVLQAGGKKYEYHTNLDGSVVVPVEALQVPGPAENAAIKQLAANLGIPESDVKLVSSAAVEWPDSCLGVGLEYVVCSQIVTPGHLIVLEGGNRQYEYHSNNDASRIMPATLALAWKQEGGIAGVCRGITVFLSGEIFGMNCAPNGDGRMGVLTAAQRMQLYAWVDQLANTTIDLSDPKGVADGMTRTADLMSHGTQPAADADKRGIFDFGQALYRQLYR